MRFPAVRAGPPAPAPLRGGFVHDVAVEGWLRAAPRTPYTGRPDVVTFSLLADIDGDGRTDLLFNDQRDFCGGFRPESRSWLLRQGSDGTLQPPALLEGVSSCQLAADLDGDGLLDLVCAAIEGGGKVVRRARSSASDPEERVRIPAIQQAMAIAAWDLDEDGALDLVLTGWGVHTSVLRNLRNRTFEDVTALWGVDVRGNSWQSAFVDLDLDLDGVRDLYVSDDGDMHENRALRLTRAGSAGDPSLARFQPLAAACDPLGFFGTSNEAAMGVALGDLDGNGTPEIVLATGPTIPVLARRTAAPFNWIDVRGSIGLDRETSTSGDFLVPWSPVLWDMDHDGWLDLWVASGDDAGFATLPNRGQSVVLVYRGLPGGSFTAAASRLGVDSTGQFAHVQVGDLDGDGDGDFDVAVGAFGGSGHVYRNQLVDVGRHVLVALRGVVSNPEGLGATVFSAAPARAHPVGDRWAPWGAAQPDLDVALSADPSADRLRVRWPSGCEQVVAGPFTGARMTVTEPAWLPLSPRGYHLRAGSGDTRTVTVAPAALGGPAGPAALVDIEDLSGSARWDGPVRRNADGTFARTLRSLPTVGSVVLQVRVDGRTLPARPRVWFD